MQFSVELPLQHGFNGQLLESQKNQRLRIGLIFIEVTSLGFNKCTVSVVFLGRWIDNEVLPVALEKECWWCFFVVCFIGWIGLDLK